MCTCPTLANGLVNRGTPPQVVCLKGERRCTAYKVRLESGPWLLAARAPGRCVLHCKLGKLGWA